MRARATLKSSTAALPDSVGRQRALHRRAHFGGIVDPLAIAAAGARQHGEIGLELEVGVDDAIAENVSCASRIEPSATDRRG